MNKDFIIGAIGIFIIMAAGAHLAHLFALVIRGEFVKFATEIGALLTVTAAAVAWDYYQSRKRK